MNNIKFIVLVFSLTAIILFSLSTYSKYSNLSLDANRKGFTLNVNTNAPSDQR